MYRYETHLHTSPVSACATAGVRETLEFYKTLGYDGVFITNHSFIGGNINISYGTPYKERVEFFFSDYEQAKELEDEIGIKVFSGVEISYGGTDFLVYGLDKQWFLENPQIADMRMSEKLAFFMEAGALVIHAHPFLEARYIDHIRLFPRHVHGVEVFNACKNDFQNGLAMQYAQNYELALFAGSDNHAAAGVRRLGGIECELPIENERELKALLLDGKINIFNMKNPLREDE